MTTPHYSQQPRKLAMKRRARWQAVAAGVALALCAALAVPSVSIADDLGDRRERAEKKIKQAEAAAVESSADFTAAAQRLNAAQVKLQAARDVLARTRAELSAAVARDRQMQQRLNDARTRLAVAEADLASGEAELNDEQDRLRRIVVAAYEQGDAGLLGLSMVFTTAEPAALAGNLKANESVVDAQSAALDQVEAANVLLEVKRRETEAAKVEVAERRQEAAANLVEKEDLEDRAAAQTREVVGLVEQRVQIRNSAARAKKRDLKELKSLTRERDRIERLIIAQTTIGGKYTGVKGNGFLSYPVPGAPLTSLYGMRVHPIYGYRSLHDGVDMGAPCGTEMIAVAPGKVIAEYTQTAYGNRLLIDHGLKFGVGVSTIYNHATNYVVVEGEEVERGQVIGYVGNTGWSTGCHLHFTVNANGKPVDPLIWF